MHEVQECYASTGRRSSINARFRSVAPAVNRLSLSEALAAAPYATGEGARIALRNQLLLGLRDMLEVKQSPAEDARRLAAELRQPDQGCAHSRLLATVRRLSRAQRAPTAHQIVRALRRNTGA